MSSDTSQNEHKSDVSDNELPVAFNSRVGSELIDLFLAHRGSDFQISGSNVRKFSAQYLQIILAAQATWKADGHILSVWPMSDELTAGLTLLGVMPELLSHKKDYTA